MKILLRFFYLAVFCFCTIAYGQSALEKSNLLAQQAQYPEAYALLLNQQYTAECNPCHKQLAELAYKAGYLKACIEHSNKALESDSTQTRCYVLLTNAYEKRGELKEAYAANAKLLRLAPKTASLYKTQARLAIQQNRGSDAIEAYLEALRLNPEDQETGYALSKLLYKLKLYKEAQHIAIQFIELDDTHVGLMALMPKILYQQKEYQAAKYWSKQLLTRQDTSTEVMKILSVSAVRTEVFDTAFICFNFLQRKNEMSEGLYYHKGVAFEQLNNTDSAQACYSKAIALAETENLGQYHYRLALSLDATAHYKGAIEHYKKAHAILQQRDILYHLARAYDNYYADKKVAIEYYQRYLEESDTIENAYTEYADARIAQIKEVIHLKLDSL